jgi:hypothetical protein
MSLLYSSDSTLDAAAADTQHISLASMLPRQNKRRESYENTETERTFGLWLLSSSLEGILGLNVAACWARSTSLKKLMMLGTGG